MEKILSPRQSQLLNFLTGAISNGQCPTIAEMKRHLGLKSVGHVWNIMKGLQKKGYIQKPKGRARSITVLRSAPPAPTGGVSVPLVGTVAAGTPILAEQNIERYITLDSLIASEAEVYLLHVKGNSMIDAGIYDGDIVLVRKQDTANPGDIIVALIDEEATIKYYQPKNGQIWLEPANPKMSSRLVRDPAFFKIQGKVVKVIHDLQSSRKDAN